MHDLIITANFCGLRVFRTVASVALYMDDARVLEIMDAETGEVYKTAAGWDGSALLPQIAELL